MCKAMILNENKVSAKTTTDVVCGEWFNVYAKNITRVSLDEGNEIEQV
jgi:hypothetical protein